MAVVCTVPAVWTIPFLRFLQTKKPRGYAGSKTLVSVGGVDAQEPPVCDPLWHEAEPLNLSDSPVWAE